MSNACQSKQAAAATETPAQAVAPAALQDPTKPLQTEAYVVPEAKAQLELRTVTLPPLGDDEVQLDITHCGLCHTDIHMRDNDWGVSNFPLVAGHEGYGVVTHVGSAVKGLKVGDKAGVGWIRDSCGCCSKCGEGFENLCQAGYQGTFLSSGAGPWGKKPFNENGCFSKAMRVKEKWAFFIPENLPPEVACPLMCAGGTLFEPIKTYVKPGMTVGIGSLGGLGTLGLQLSRKMGAKVTVFTRGTAKKEAALRIGAEAFTDYTNEAEMQAAEGSIDVFIDTCPANAAGDLEKRMGLLKIDGTYVRVGIPSGSTHDFSYQFIPLIFTGKKIAGSIVCGSTRQNEMVELVSKNKEEFCSTGAWTASTVMPFSEINAAMDKLSRGDMSAYRVVLKW